MPEYDLQPFFCSNPSNLKFYELQQCSVVIDGDDFIRFIWSRIDSDTEEYLKFSLEASAVLARFVHCGIEPIFVFEGIVQDKAGQFTISDESTTSASLAQDTLLSVLKYYASRQVVVNMPVFRAASSLAANLRCPLLGSKNAYFLMGGGSEVARPKFFPLFLLLTEPAPAQNSSMLHQSAAHCAAGGLAAYAFSPIETILNQLDTAYWPVLSVLWSSGLIAHHNQLLRQDGFRVEAPTPQAVHARLNELIDWIKHPTEATLDQLASVLFEGDRDLLTEACSMFVYMPRTVGKWIKSLVHVSQTNDSLCLDTEDEHQHSNILIDLDVSLPTDHGSSETQIVAGWPPKLTQAYRQGEIILSMLAPIYLPERSKQRVRLESVDGVLAPPVQLVALMFARLLIGLEQRIGNQHKLLGLDPDQMSLILKSRSPQPRRIRVESYQLDFRQDHTDTVLCHLFNLPQSIEMTKPDWLLSLAFTLSLWYQQAVRSDWFNVPLKECSMALAMTAIAVTTIYNVDYSHTELLPHYERVAHFVQGELTKSLERRVAMAQPPHPDPNREFSAIQSIYRSFRSLVMLLDGIVRPDAESKLFRFLPPWIVFPSRTLVHHLVAHLDLQLSTTRFDHVSYFWLPKLLLTSGRPDALEQARDVFNRLLDLASILMIQPNITESPRQLITCDPTQCGASSDSWSRGKLIEEHNSRVSSEWTRGNIQPVLDNGPRSALREVSNFTPLRF